MEEKNTFTDNFIVKGPIGQGGIGRVFLATEKNLEREVAIKELLPPKEEKQKKRKLARFLREARISGKLEHPGIVPVYELGFKPDGTPFYVMKYVKGDTLDKIIKECEFDSPESSFRRRMSFLDNFIAVCDAIGYAHSKKIIHRDLKPGNIIIGEFGETVILDWGLAKKIGEKTENSAEEPAQEQEISESDAFRTIEGAKMGTPAYMPPEQIDPRFGEMDERSDVYSLGVILFILLTGQKPYAGDAKTVMEKITSGAPSPSPLSRGSYIPHELAAICAKAMSKDKTVRFANAHEMAAELRAYRDGRLVSIYAYSKRELFARFIARNRTAIIGAAAVVLSIIIGAVFSVNFAVDARREKAKAERALVEVTNLSEKAMVLARSATSSVNRSFFSIISEMSEIAHLDHDLKLSAGSDKYRRLMKIMDLYPAAEAFFTMTMKGGIRSIFPSKYAVPAGFNSISIEKIMPQIKSYGFALSPVFVTKKREMAFFLHVPVYRYGRMIGLFTTIMRTDKIRPDVLAYDPETTDFRIWGMQNDGLILYDEDPSQIGLFLFTDGIYKNFPELLKFGEEIRKEPWGIGYYSFLAENKKDTIYKIAAWDTVMDPINWKIIVTHPYLAR
jgi:serine/threonine-protein kinase